MNKHHLVFIGLLLLQLSCKDSLKGDGDIMKNEILLMQAVDKINLSGNFEAVLIQDTSNKVIVEAQENIVKNLSVKEEGEELNISELQSVRTNEIYRVYIYTTGIESLEINDNVSFDVSGELRSDDFSIDIADNSIINCQVFMDNLELHANDNAKITFKGNCSDFDASLEDNVKFISPKFIVNSADLDIADNVEANFQIIKELKGKGSGNSVLEYGGNPDKNFQAKDQSRLIKTK